VNTEELRRYSRYPFAGGEELTMLSILRRRVMAGMGASDSAGANPEAEQFRR
jgi:hypothetical protein